MLIVDINTLEAINLLYLCDDVVLDCLCAVDCEYIRRVDGALCERVTCVHDVAVMHLYLVAVRDSICFLVGILQILACDGDMLLLFHFLDPYDTCKPCDDSRALWLTALKQLLDSRKTLCDIFRGSDTARMEGTHRKLCTRLTDRLCGDYADSLADLNDVACCQVCAVALSAHAVFSAALEHRSDLDRVLALFFECSDYLSGIVFIYELGLGADHFACLSVLEVFYKVSADKSFCERLDHFVSVLDIEYLDANCTAAVSLVNDNVL